MEINIKIGIAEYVSMIFVLCQWFAGQTLTSTQHVDHDQSAAEDEAWESLTSLVLETMKALIQ